MRQVRVLSTALAVLLVAAGAAAQEMQHEGHDMHGMSMGDAVSGELVWRMPPMDPNMPMLPGIMSALPAVRPMLPGFDLDPADFPRARPREVCRNHPKYSFRKCYG